MASYPTAEDEKRLLAHAAETTTTMAADNQCQTKCQRACRRRVAQAKKVAHFTVTLAFIVACCIAVFGLGSLAVGTMRHAKPCTKHNGAANKAGGAHQNGAVVVVAQGGAASAGSSFSRLLEAVSPESLHDLLHEHLPDTYKHGVYPSEKHALEAIHRENAALATSIIQLARRDLNGTTSSTTPVSSTPTSTPPTSSTLPTSTFKNSSTSSTTTPSHTSSKTTSSTSPTTTGKKVTSIYTSTINGTPTVVTATSVVGVGATNTGGTTTNSGTLQTGAAVPMLGGNKARLAEAVAGVLVGAMLI